MEVIVACDFSTAGIGYKGFIPWSLSEDMEHFKTITTSTPPGKHNMVIMGRNTWESLYQIPLRGRLNVVVTSHEPAFCQFANVAFVRTLHDAFRIAVNDTLVHKVFVIGGSRLYEEALRSPLCHTAYVTYVHKSGIVADTFFPIDLLNRYFEVYKATPILRSKNNIHYSLFTYKRKNDAVSKEKKK